MSTARPRIQATPTCSLRASGAIIGSTITYPPERSAIARAAIAATTRTQSPRLQLICLSGDCGAERTDHRRRAVSGSSCFRYLHHPKVPSLRSVGAARDCALVGKGSDGGAGRPRARVHTHPPALNAHCGSFLVRIGLGLRLYGNSRLVAAMPSPLMNIWDATFKEKGAGGLVDVAACIPGACNDRYAVMSRVAVPMRYGTSPSRRRPQTRGPTWLAQLHAGTTGTPSRSLALHSDNVNAAMCEPLNNLATHSLRTGRGGGPVLAQPLG